jgi:hypothetical protein
MSQAMRRAIRVAASLPLLASDLAGAQAPAALPIDSAYAIGGLASFWLRQRLAAFQVRVESWRATASAGKPPLSCARTITS